MIEKAALGFGVDRVAVALRNAPAWVHADIAKRRGRGNGLPAAVASKPTPAKPSRTCGGWIVGCAAPGVSAPVHSPQDGLTLREEFTKAAWQSVLDHVAAGKHVEFQQTHRGIPLASTADGSLRLRLHPIVGLLFEAELVDEAMDRVAIHAATCRMGSGCSVGYVRPRLRYETRLGERIRIIEACCVDHIALCPTGRRPAFAGARCFGVAKAERANLENAWRDARCAAAEAIRKEFSYG